MEDIAIEILLDNRLYTIDSVETEIRADRHCAQLLRHFHRWLLEQRREEPLWAGRLAAGADYFLREFMIGRLRRNIFQAEAEHLRQFGGNWYIISNLEPNLPELEPMLAGSALFYTYCAEQGCFNPQTAAEIHATVEKKDFFHERIEQFHQLQDDDYRAWDQACSIG